MIVCKRLWKIRINEVTHTFYYVIQFFLFVKIDKSCRIIVRIKEINII